MHETHTTASMTQLRTTLAPRVTNRRALALLDVLIGMAIFGLIAGIAVVALGQFRARAFESGAVSDVTALGTAIEGQTTNGGQYPVTLSAAGDVQQTISVATPATGFDLSHVLTKNNKLVGYKYVEPTATNSASFHLCVEHQSNGKADAYAVYDSLKGGLVAKSYKEGCSAAASVDAKYTY